MTTLPNTIIEKKLGEELRPKFESILNRLSREDFDKSDISIVHGEVVALFSEMYRGLALAQSTERAKTLEEVRSVIASLAFRSDKVYTAMDAFDVVNKLSINGNVDDNKEEVGATSEARPKGGATE